MTPRQSQVGSTWRPQIFRRQFETFDQDTDSFARAIFKFFKKIFQKKNIPYLQTAARQSFTYARIADLIQWKKAHRTFHHSTCLYINIYYPRPLTDFAYLDLLLQSDQVPNRFSLSQQPDLELPRSKLLVDSEYIRELPVLASPRTQGIQASGHSQILLKYQQKHKVSAVQRFNQPNLSRIR